MRGLHTESITDGKDAFEEILGKILPEGKLQKIEQFRDDGEGVLTKYNVYKVSAESGTYVLKKSDDKEIFAYEKLLRGKELPVPEYYGCAEHDSEKWILIEFLEGIDLRNFTEEMAHACAKSICQIMSMYWQNSKEEFEENKLDDRFERYWARINKRAECLESEPEMKAAYELFLKRQLECPRTLCNGDFLQYNGVYNEANVKLIDWAFAGIMPYALDIARLIAHGTEDITSGFPFYMDDRLREIFVWEVYEGLRCKPEKERYIQDIRLALLNEYVEFIEWDLNEGTLDKEDYHYRQAVKVAREISMPQ